MLTPETVLKKHFEAKGYVFDHFKNWLDFKVHLPTIYAAMGEYASQHTAHCTMSFYSQIDKLNRSAKSVGLKVEILANGELDIVNIPKE